MQRDWKLHYELSLCGLDLTTSESVVMSALLKHSAVTTTLMSFAELAEKTGYSVATTKKALRALQQKQLILINVGDESQGNLYEILPPPHLPYENGYVTLPRSHPGRPNGFFKKRWPG